MRRTALVIAIAGALCGCGRAKGLAVDAAVDVLVTAPDAAVFPDLPAPADLAPAVDPAPEAAAPDAAELDMPGGNAVLGAVPSQWGWRLEALGDGSLVPTIMIINNGSDFSGPVSASIEGPDAADCVLTGNTCAPPLAPGHVCYLMVAFHPLSLGTRTAQIVVRTTLGKGVTVPLSSVVGPAPARLVLTPAVGRFGNVALGMTGYGDGGFDVTNRGYADSGRLVRTIEGRDAAEFSIVTTCADALPPGLGCPVVVAFRPTSAGSKQTTLVVSATPGGEQRANLVGTGVMP
jgi:hypothetical protein